MDPLVKDLFRLLANFLQRFCSVSALLIFPTLLVGIQRPKKVDIGSSGWGHTVNKLYCFTLFCNVKQNLTSLVYRFLILRGEGFYFHAAGIRKYVQYFNLKKDVALT